MSERPGVRIHPTAEVAADAEIGQGTSIWHHVHVRERAVIGRHCVLGKGVFVDFEVRLGDNCKLQNGVYVYHPAEIAAGVFLGPGVIITNDRYPRAVNPDGSPKAADDWQATPVRIDEGASIGAGSVIVAGVHIGCWAMIGAGAVVTKDVPDYGLALGSPARLVGYTCPCGRRLTLQSADGDYFCPHCGRTLRLRPVGRINAKTPRRKENL